MATEQKTYEARKSINPEEMDLFDDVFLYFHDNGAVHGMWESYKSDKVPVQEVSDADLGVLDRLDPQQARLFRIQNELVDEGFIEEEQWSAYHIKLDDLTYKGLRVTLVSKPENEDQPETSNLVVTMTAEGENVGKKLADVVGRFGFKEI